MDILIFIMQVFAGGFVFLICFIVIRVIITKKLPDNYNYTPFDYITAHTNVEFHEEKEEKEEDDDQGDDKNKNERNIKEGFNERKTIAE